MDNPSTILLRRRTSIGLLKNISRGGQNFPGPPWVLKIQFPQESLKTYYFWPASGGEQEPFLALNPPDAHENQTVIINLPFKMSFRL